MANNFFFDLFLMLNFNFFMGNNFFDLFINVYFNFFQWPIIVWTFFMVDFLCSKIKLLIFFRKNIDFPLNTCFAIIIPSYFTQIWKWYFLLVNKILLRLFKHDDLN